MKARVKETGEIVEVTKDYDLRESTIVEFYTNTEDPTDVFEKEELEFPYDSEFIDYWTRLEHQYAGMAMQGIVKSAYNAYCDNCANYENMIFEDAQALLKDHAEILADVCVEFAHALVEKLKESK